jgi:hypothetical protein
MCFSQADAVAEKAQAANTAERAAKPVFMVLSFMVKANLTEFHPGSRDFTKS